MKPKRTVSVSGPTLIAVAAAATLATFAIVGLVVPEGTYVRNVFFERSWIQPATTFAFWLTVSMLVVKQRAYIRQHRAFEAASKILEDPYFERARIFTESESVKRLFSHDAHDAHRSSRAFTRILNGLDRLEKMQSTGKLEDYFRNRSEIDAEELDTSYTGVRYLIWLIPTLGFIGTVLGISQGIGGFASIVQNAQDFGQVRDALPTVTAQLGTAFDTTLLALGLSALAAFYMSFLLRLEQGLLEAIDNLSFDRVCALFREHSTESERIVTAIKRGIGDLQRGMSGNRGSIEQVIREQLPEHVIARLRDLASETGMATALRGILEVLESREAIDGTVERTTDLPPSTKPSSL